MAFFFVFSLFIFQACNLTYSPTSNQTPTPGPTTSPTGAATSTPTPTETPTPSPTPIATSMSELIGSNTVSEITSGGITFTFGEGPTWHPDGFLIFSDTDAGTGARILKIDSNNMLSVFASTQIGGVKYFTNGLGVDAQKNVIMSVPSEYSPTASPTFYRSHAIKKMNPANTAISLLTNSIGGQAFHSTNDLSIKSNGDIYFTDNTFGGTGPLAYKGVFRFNPNNNETTLLDGTRFTGGKQPNGITFSPDEKKLYVADTIGNDVTSYTVKSDGTLEGAATFATGTDQADGIKTTVQGHLLVSVGQSGLSNTWGIKVFHPDGTYMGLIPTNGAQPANCAFGGSDKKTLYITARTKVYKIQFLVAGK